MLVVRLIIYADDHFLLMDKKMTIGLIVVVAVVIIVGALIAVGMTSNNNNDDGNKYVTYDGNGHNTTDGDATVRSDESKIPYISWNYSGYALKCYNEKKDGSGTSYNVGDSAPYGKTLYAQYEEAKSVKVNLVDIPSYISVKYNGTAVTSGQSFSNDQCKFEFEVSADSAHSLTIDDGIIFIKDSEDKVIGKITPTYKAYGGGTDKSMQLLTVVTISITGYKELTLTYAAAA